MVPLPISLHRINRINFADKTMADCISRKHMGKRFRLSSEVRATLQRKHDSWTPYRAYNRVEKELGVFRAILKIILSFFKMPPKTDEGEVGCNGRAVKMFADLIKRSFRDEDDFVSRKCTTFNVVLFFYYRIIRFLLMVRFVNDFLFIFSFVIIGCTLDTGLLSADEMQKLVSGAIVHGSQEENEMAIKVCLELITMCANMTNIRVGATDSALQYLLNNTTTNDFKSNLIFKRKSTFTTSSDDGSTAADGGESTETAGKCCKITTTVVNEGESKVDKTTDLDVVVPDEYELNDFSISDEGIISFEGELMF